VNTRVAPVLPRFVIGNAAPGFAELRAGNLGVRLAVTAAELDAVQALRYRVFYGEMGARADLATSSTRSRTICWWSIMIWARVPRMWWGRTG